MSRDRTILCALVLGMLFGWSGCARDRQDAPRETVQPERGDVRFRIALFNVKELTAEKVNDVDTEGNGSHPQLVAAARVIQAIRPDVLVLQEVDHDCSGDGQDLAAHTRHFLRRYLNVGETAIDYPFVFAAPNNTGRLSGHDLDDNGTIATEADRGNRTHGGDCFGYGAYPGQYSMAILSRHEIRDGALRSFQLFRWKDLPGHHIPVDFYSEEELDVFRLSSKSHWDVPISVDGREIHLWVSHPTPPVFDGDEDRNGRRNFDEIKLWAEYLKRETTLVDDQGSVGGYAREAPFVILGDLNARPGARVAFYDGQPAIDQLLRHPRVQDPGDLVQSRGALGSRASGPPHYPERATATFGGGSRVDYVLPSRELRVVDGGVYWPRASDDPEGAAWADEASDHRLVWLDLAY